MARGSWGPDGSICGLGNAGAVSGRTHKRTSHDPTAAGLFDIDHMGQVEVRGREAEAFVNWMVTYNVPQMKPWMPIMRYFATPMDGTVDDLFVYRLPDPETEERDYFFLAINASNRHKDFAWFEAHAADFEVSIRDISDETYMLAFQGPKATADSKSPDKDGS